MSSQLVCRICLACDVRMHLIISTELQIVYEKLCGNALQSLGKPLTACYVCFWQLRKCLLLMKRALKAEELLNQILSSGDDITNTVAINRDTKNLRLNLEVSPIQHSVHIPECFDDVTTKDEQHLITDKIKLESGDELGADNHESNDVCSQVNDVSDSTSDSEDDVPLKSISNNGMTRSTTTHGTKEKQYVKDVKIYAREIILTHEEQMRDLLKRANSLNYINSPYKCDVCYKGFVEPRAYENHKEKHDEISGPFACAVCGMRYRSERLLRSHATVSHSRLYQCNRCPHLAHTANQARVHEKWHNGHIYECQLCSQQFKKPTSYFTHIRKRHPSEHVCAACGACFVSGHGLRMHRGKAHCARAPQEDNPDEPAAERFCSECNIQFDSMEAWRRHIVSSIKHTLGNADGSHCRICSVRISGESVSDHMKEHRKALNPRAVHTDRPVAELSCDQCGATFGNRSKLHAHVKRVHLGLKYNKNIVCEVCGKKCTSNATLKYHQRTHTGERPHLCPCGKRFASTNLLRLHGRTHSGEQPYCCAVCGKRFSQKPALNRHYRVHTGAKPYECQYCSKTFSQSNSLKLHVRAVHLKLPPNNKRNKVQSTTNDVEEKIEAKEER